MQAGENDIALKYYNKSVELNHENENMEMILRQINNNK